MNLAVNGCVCLVVGGRGSHYIGSCTNLLMTCRVDQIMAPLSGGSEVLQNYGLLSGYSIAVPWSHQPHLAHHRGSLNKSMSCVKFFGSLTLVHLL